MYSCNSFDVKVEWIIKCYWLDYIICLLGYFRISLHIPYFSQDKLDMLIRTSSHHTHCTTQRLPPTYLHMKRKRERERERERDREGHCSLVDISNLMIYLYGLFQHWKYFICKLHPLNRVGGRGGEESITF